MFFTFNVYSGVLLPFFVQGVVVAGVLAVRSQREDAGADKWLALLLLLHALRLAQWMLGFAGWYDSHDARTVFMFYFPFSNWLAVGPVLYFYFRSLTNQEFHLRRQHWRHFVPALAWVGWRLVVFVYDVGWWHGMQQRALPAHYGTKGPLAFWADQQPIGYWVDAVAYLLVLAYAVRTLQAYRVYAHYLNDNFSDTAQIRFRWLRNVLVAVVIGTLVMLGFGFINTWLLPLSYYQAWYDYLFTGLLLYYLSIAGLLTGHRLAGLHFQPKEAAESLVPTVEAATTLAQLPSASPLTTNAAPDLVLPVVAAEVQPENSAELERWTQRLLRHMETQRPYLASELTLGELAAQLRTNTSWLSRVINTGCGQNFNDFINEFRVREAERRLLDPHYRHYTLLAVALEAGFNSKSTFNRVFKKLRGLTPSQVGRQG
ncbi:helix-turn-helix domain-containing protein [Hymenobacter glacieicola]|uniref:HTH araC/xylS-type domain-containing protein n=1 Tax=Hymenobacter glacieicola TaxID=1562124 RepID=A0ABQ1WTT9_9BACT|nr:AraC family transcriptional regulator [Hymenobacter glacieicola]GGG41469.1 hypothetical protein GCM10011378_17190 [Hymenobacter glacieicola]